MTRRISIYSIGHVRVINTFTIRQPGFVRKARGRTRALSPSAGTSQRGVVRKDYKKHGFLAL